jgi:hypothetical protein
MSAATNQELNAMNLATRKQDDRSTAEFFNDMADDDFGPVDTAKAKQSKKYEKREPTDRAEKLYTEKCGKCNGTGIYRAPSSYGTQCFQCNGKGVLTFKTPKAVRDANKIKAVERKEKKMAENLAAFESEYPQIAAWWTGNDFPFALSLKESVRKFGNLTAGQLAAALRCVEKLSAAKAAKEERAAASSASAKAVDITPIQAAFERAKAKGLKHPKMYLLGGDVKLCFSRAPDSGKNAGAVYVKESTTDGTYLGKIQGGKFFSSRDCSPELGQAVERACSDPENAAIAFGKKFGVCSCCGRYLADPVSVANGIGPICASNFFG